MIQEKGGDGAPRKSRASYRSIQLSATGYTAVIRQDGKWWIGWIEEIPGVNCQGETRDELIANLHDALSEAIELNREDAKSAAGESFEEIAILP